MRNIKMVLEYDGTRYHGWQRQKNRLTIQQLLEEAIHRITQESATVIGSGRTDAGVHAINQVANFLTSSTLDETKLIKGINSILPNDIVVKQLYEIDGSFHARYHAKSKIYLYQIFNHSIRSALARFYAWFVREPLDFDSMKEAALLLTGKHDFSSFCASGCRIKNHIRTVNKIDLEDDKYGMLRIYVEADGFLKYMVRNMVGMLVDVGRGRRNPSEITSVIDAKDRKKAAITAPPHGLFLKEVKY